MVIQVLKRFGACLGLGLALFIGPMNGTASAQERIPLTLLVDAVNPALYGADPYINYYALVKGKVQAEGLKLDVKPFWPWDTTRLMVAGQADVGMMTINGYLMAKDRGVPLVMIGVQQIVKPDIPANNSMFGRRASGIKTPKDLEGKKVGIPGLTSASAIYHRAILQHKYGVNTDKIIWVDKGTPELYTLLKQGDIDAANLFAGVAERAAKEAGLELMYIAPNVWKEMTGMPFITLVIAAKKALVERQPQALRSLMEAVKLSKKYGEEHQKEILAEALKEFGSERAPGTIWQPIDLVEEHKEAVKLYMKYSVEQKIIRKEIDPSALFSDLK